MDHVETEPALDAERVRRWREERLARDYERVAAAARGAHDAVGDPDRRRLHAAGRRGHRPRARHRAARASTPTRAARTRACTAAGRGRSARSRGSARPRTPTAATSTCSPTARPGSRPTSTCRRCSATTPTTRSTGARSGKIGVAVDTVVDMHALFDGIPLDEVSTSLTINAPAAVAARDVPRRRATSAGSPGPKLTGTTQNDILKEYTAQNEFIFPPVPSVELVVDTMEYGAEVMPRFNPLNACGYHIRDAGSTAVQEVGAHDRRRRSATSSAPASAGSTPTAWRRACRSSGTCTTTSSRRSRSSAPPAGCGRG